MLHLAASKGHHERELLAELKNGKYDLSSAQEQELFIQAMQCEWSDIRMGTLREMARDLGVAFSTNGRQRHDELIWSVVAGWIAAKIDEKEQIELGDPVVVKNAVAWTRVKCSDVVHEIKYKQHNADRGHERQYVVRRTTIEEATLSASQITKANT
jgi:hypothetical protein